MFRSNYYYCCIAVFTLFSAMVVDAKPNDKKSSNNGNGSVTGIIGKIPKDGSSASNIVLSKSSSNLASSETEHQCRDEYHGEFNYSIKVNGESTFDRDHTYDGALYHYDLSSSNPPDSKNSNMRTQHVVDSSKPAGRISAGCTNSFHLSTVYGIPAGICVFEIVLQSEEEKFIGTVTAKGTALYGFQNSVVTITGSYGACGLKAAIGNISLSPDKLTIRFQ